MRLLALTNAFIGLYYAGSWAVTFGRQLYIDRQGHIDWGNFNGIYDPNTTLVALEFSLGCLGVAFFLFSLIYIWRHK